LRVCIVYDCLYPYTVGGAERWYRRLAERLAREGHQVTFLTRRQWAGTPTRHPEGVEVVAVSSDAGLYDGDGKRRILPPLLFGWGVLRHLLARGRAYDVVHTASFPYFSVLAATVARRRGRFALMVDWHEFWSRAYWRSYLGPLGGEVGWRVQRLCLQTPQRPFCFAQVTAARLREAGVRGEVTVLEGEYEGPLQPAPPRPAGSVVVAVGRHIPEKRMPAAVAGVAEARRRLPDLQARIFGDGPDRPAVLAAIAEHGLEEQVLAPGFAPTAEVEAGVASALCLLHPSSREGYGLVVLEAAAAGTPVVLAAGEDNAAVELIEEGVNGFVAPSAAPADLAEAILQVHRGGVALRTSTREWFVRNAERLSMEGSVRRVLAAYRELRPDAA
jgi:glycosyltransferase involved in cell wall biosynthesis